MKKPVKARSRASIRIRAKRPRSRPPRRSTDAALAQSEARFRSLTELSSDWYWEQDAELRFVSTSGRSRARGGITVADHPGKRRWELPGTEIVGQTWPEHQAVLAGRKPFRDLMLRRTATDGTDHYVMVSGEPFFDARGAFAGYRGVAKDVTAHKRAEEALAQSEREAHRRLSEAIEHLNESIAIMDAEDHIVVANRYFRELNGGTHLVEPGHKYEEHLRAGIPLGNYPEAAGREEAWLQARLARHRAGGTIELQRQDGKWLHVTDQRLPEGGMISFALDITERKKTELALAQSERRFRDFAEASLDWFWETDAEGRYIWFSDSVERVGGAKPEWHYGKKRTELAASCDLGAEPWKSHLEALERHEPFRDFRYERAGPNGSNWLSVSGTPYFDHAGKFAGYRGSGTDVTEKVKADLKARAAEDALRDTNADLERRVAERTAALETAYRELESFSYSVSHDLRSPLGVIASFAGILARQEAGRISEDGMRLVSVIDENAQRMGHLIDALLELMGTSRRALVFRQLDMNGIAATTCSELQRAYPQARIEIGALPAAQGDEMLIRQVYANLAGNALKFSSKIDSPCVELGAEAGNGATVYFVRDNGAGFDTDHAAKLFKPFERLHSEQEYPGTGIGLALVHLIVQRHGGRIWAESAPGRGSTFRFTLAGDGPG